MYIFFIKVLYVINSWIYGVFLSFNVGIWVNLKFFEGYSEVIGIIDSD